MFLLSYYNRGRSGSSSNKSFDRESEAVDYAADRGLVGSLFSMAPPVNGISELTFLSDVGRSPGVSHAARPSDRVQD